MNEFLFTKTTITTTTTTHTTHTTNPLPRNVPRKHYENETEFTSMNTQRSQNIPSMLNNTNHRPLRSSSSYNKWRPHHRMKAPTPTPSYNRIHYVRRAPSYRPFDASHSNPLHGVLKWFNSKQQYGFIEHRHKDIFVHESAFNSSIPIHQIPDIIGETVQFEIEDYVDKKSGKLKQKAIDVRRIKQASITQTCLNTSNVIQADQSIKRETKEHCGTLLWFNESSKFGFIRCDGEMKENEDLFVYESELKFDRESLYKGMRLQFDIEIYRDYQSKERKKAINVVIESTNNRTQNRNTFSGKPWRLNPHKKHNKELNYAPPNHSRLHYSSYSRSSYLNCNRRPKYKGCLLWFSDEKKHGFIECDDEAMMDDVFVYETDLIFPKYLIQKDMRLLFDIKVYTDYHRKQRQKAVNVIIDETHTTDHKPKFNVDAAEFVPSNAPPNKMLLEAIIEEANEIEEMTPPPPPPPPKKKRAKKKKHRINVEKLFIEHTDYKVIAQRLFDVYIMNQKEYDLKDCFDKLYGLHRSYRTELFLAVNLEFLSLMEEDKSIFDVIAHVNEYRDTYLRKLLSIDGVQCDVEFTDYGLQCLYPAQGVQCIRELIGNECDIESFVEHKCYAMANYEAMYELMDYLIPKYKDDMDGCLGFIEWMVDAQDIADCDNNNKVLLLSIGVSVLNAHGLLNQYLLHFMKGLLHKEMICLDVIEKWRLDEWDTITKAKKRALVILADLIHELQNKEIKENELEEDDDDDDVCLLMNIKTNMNRTVSKRCPWKQIITC